MNKQITIYDYDSRPVAITIENFENVKSISCKVISGDEVLRVKYNDNTIKTFDSNSTRLHGYYGGKVDIPLEKLDDISTISDSYAMLEHFISVQRRKKYEDMLAVKVVEIIRAKLVDFNRLNRAEYSWKDDGCSSPVEYYNKGLVDYCQLTEEEYNLLVDVIGIRD